MNLIEKMKNYKTALIVLDVQNDFCHSEGAFSKKMGWDYSAVQEMVLWLKIFIEEARNAGCKIIFSKMINDKKLSPKNLQERLLNEGEKKAEEWPFALQKNSWGREIFEIKPKENDLVLDKVYYDFFTNLDLKKELDKFNAKNLIITGVYTEVCVLATAYRGFSEEYNIIIPRDLVESIIERKKIKLEVLDLANKYIAEVIDSEKIIEIWKLNNNR